MGLASAAGAGTSKRPSTSCASSSAAPSTASPICSSSSATWARGWPSCWPDQSAMPVSVTKLKRPVGTYLRQNVHYSISGFNCTAGLPRPAAAGRRRPDHVLHRPPLRVHGTGAQVPGSAAGQHRRPGPHRAHQRRAAPAAVTRAGVTPQNTTTGGAMSACARSHIVISGTSSGIGRAAALDLAAAGHHVFAGIRQPGDAPVPHAARLGRDHAAAGCHRSRPDRRGRRRRGRPHRRRRADRAGEQRRYRRVRPARDHPGRAVPPPAGGQRDRAARRLPGAAAAVAPGTRPDRADRLDRYPFTPPFTGPVSASKSAIATMAEALRQELAPWDIRVVLIEPASIHTEAVRMDRRFQVRGRSGCLGSTLPGQQPDSAGAGDMHWLDAFFARRGQHPCRTS